jgi:hypothetical protein
MDPAQGLCEIFRFAQKDKEIKFIDSEFIIQN